MQIENNWHSKTKEEIFKEFKTSYDGLSQEEAEKRLQKYGKNTIKKTHRLRPLKILLQQFNSFLIYILIIASIVSFFIGYFIDGIVIGAITLINAGIGFFQQYKAEKAIINLRSLIIQRSRVIREEKIIEINSEELVPGDIIILNHGDKINADCRIIESENLQTNEAVLTGESLPVDKFSKILDEKTMLNDKRNMIFMGTQIVRGSCKAVVVYTGMSTEFGKIAESLQDIEIQKTPMQKKLDKFSKQVGYIILSLVSVILILGVVKNEAFKIFLTSVALAVSAIPEGLPAVLAISFAISSIAMSKKNVIIRRLPAVESLGSVTVICSDKTGTITEEKMAVQKIFSNNNIYIKNGKELFFKNKKIDVKKNLELFQLLKTSILCNNARFEVIKDKYEIIGDPTEQALVAASLDFGLNKKEMTKSEPSVKRFEFDSKRKMMSIIRDKGRNRVIYSKGAIESILEVCGSEMINGQIKNLNDKRKKEILENSNDMEKDALRVLAFAFKNITTKTIPKEEGLIFLGFIGMIDPPRPQVKEAVRECRNAGIKIKMITGDSAVTAMAIAKQIGITGEIVTEKELMRMSDAELSKRIDRIAIFARTTPVQKLRITRILQANGEIVAITGDGVNDSLALKSADIGIAMGQRGSDIARDVSDIILIDDNFASIVEGIKEGRKVYDNTKKFTKYLLAVNFSGIFLIISSLILSLFYGAEKWFLPLLPLQILWINLITDSLPALSLIMEKGEKVMENYPKKEKGILEGVWKFLITAGLILFLMEIIIYIYGANFIGEEKTRTMILTAAIFFELFFVYTCRSNKPIWEIGILSNKWLNYAVIFSIILHLILIYTPLSILFGVVQLSLADWLFIIPFSISGIALFEIGKYVRDRKK